MLCEPSMDAMTLHLSSCQAVLRGKHASACHSGSRAAKHSAVKATCLHHLPRDIGLCLQHGGRDCACLVLPCGLTVQLLWQCLPLKKRSCTPLEGQAQPGVLSNADELRCQMYQRT